LLWFALLNTVLDLPIAAVLAAQNQAAEAQADHLEHVAAAANCWDHILDQAVTTKPSPGRQAVLMRESQACVALDP
jgi:hypothetical protein